YQPIVGQRFLSLSLSEGRVPLPPNLAVLRVSLSAFIAVEVFTVPWQGALT
ncbi:hypothetical protein L9F63_013462, partial [Diploptera punctata]